MSDAHLFCFGLGYCAEALAHTLLAEGWRVSGTSRHVENFGHFKTHGITPYLFSEELPLPDIWDFNSVTHLLISIPPSPTQGDIVLTHHLPDLQALPNLQWVGYLSTTGVYGDHAGGWVDENTPVNPPNDRSRLRVEAEQAWLATGFPVHLFRLSGIYGPGRSAFDALKNGTARRIDKPGQVFSRIHVEDIVQVLRASIAQPHTGSIYNVADDEPAPQADVVAYAAQLLGLEPPPLIPYDDTDKLSDMARSFYASCRRVSNRKLREELGVTLRYPTYREGLGGC